MESLRRSLIFERVACIDFKMYRAKQLEKRMLKNIFALFGEADFSQLPLQRELLINLLNNSKSTIRAGILLF